jgi:hypothetical protein
VQVATPWQPEVTWSLRARHVSSPEERSGVKPTTKRSWTYLKQEKNEGYVRYARHYATGDSEGI